MLLISVILAIQEAEIIRTVVLGHPRQKADETRISTNKKLDVVACACYPSYAGSINGRITVQACHS
jgi:hypothetical protein